MLKYYFSAADPVTGERGKNADGGHSRQGPDCTTADAQPAYRPPPSAPTVTSDMPTVLQMPTPLHGAGGVTTSSVKQDFVQPRRVITISGRNLDDSYIDEMLQDKGLKGPQITKIRSGLRRYIDSFTGNKGIELDEGAYTLLTNMLIHLIEESSKDE